MDNSPRNPGPTLAYCSMQEMRAEVPRPRKPLPMHLADIEVADLLEWISDQIVSGPVREAVTDISAYLLARSCGDDGAARAALRAGQICRDIQDDRHAG